MDLKVDQKVDLIIGVETSLGFTVLIDEQFEGLLYKNEVYRELAEGEKTEGYVKNIREDGKIDVSLRAQGFKQTINPDVEKVLEKLKSNKGELMLSDKSSPESIKFQLEMSKKAFKRAIGHLYKEKKISIEKDKIILKLS